MFPQCMYRKSYSNKTETLNYNTTIVDPLELYPTYTQPNLIYKDYLSFTDSNYSDVVKFLRGSLKLTQKLFSTHFGISNKMVSLWELNKYPPTREHYKKIITMSQDVIRNR